MSSRRTWLSIIQKIAVVVFGITAILIYVELWLLPRAMLRQELLPTPPQVLAVESPTLDFLATEIARADTPVAGTPGAAETIRADSVVVASDTTRRAAELEAQNLRNQRLVRQASPVLSAVNLLIANLVSLATFIATTIYRIWDERRTRTKYKLDVAKTELEILKLQKELEETQQKEKKRRP